MFDKVKNAEERIENVYEKITSPLETLENSTGKTLTQYFAWWYEKLFSMLIFGLIFLSILATYLIYEHTALGRDIQNQPIIVHIFFCLLTFGFINLVFIFNIFFILIKLKYQTT
jgi:hypothetical protein